LSLGIVIVTHDSAEMLPRCLDGIGPRRLASTLVVDNASGDTSAEIAEASGARVLRLSENLGFGRAATLAARSLATPHLCFLNPDCEPGPGLFEAGEAALRGGPRRCAAPGLVEPGGLLEGSQPGYTRTKLLADMIENHYGRNSARWLRRLSFHHDRSWSWPHGACFFIDRALFEEVEGFDAAYFLYMEDVDLGRRIAAAGGEVLALPERILHHGGRGTRIARRDRRILLDAGRLLYGRRVYGRGFEILLRGATLPARWRRRLKERRA